MITPLNTEWNRKTGILPENGHLGLLGNKHGITYFTWTTLDGSLLFLLCDEFVFKKHFKSPVDDRNIMINPAADLEAMLKKKTKFLKYPFDIVR